MKSVTLRDLPGGLVAGLLHCSITGGIVEIRPRVEKMSTEIERQELERRAGDPSLPYDERMDAAEQLLASFWAQAWGVEEAD